MDHVRTQHQRKNTNGRPWHQLSVLLADWLADWLSALIPSLQNSKASRIDNQKAAAGSLHTTR